MLQEENSSGWAGRPSEVWARDAHWPFFAHSDHPLHSQTLIYELQLVYLYLVDLLVQERVVQTNFSLTENPISHCLTVFCSNLVSVQINPNRTEILALIPKLRALTVTNDNRNDNDRNDNDRNDNNRNDNDRNDNDRNDNDRNNNDIGNMINLVAESSQRMGRLVLWLALAVLLPAPAILQPLDQVALDSIVCFSILSDFFHVLILRPSWKSMSR